MQLKSQRLSKNQSDFDKLVEQGDSIYYTSFNFDHHSWSQLNIASDGHWAWKYFKVDQDIRRQFKFEAKPRLGVAVGGGVALVFADRLWTNNSQYIDIDKLSFRQFLLYVQAELNKYKPMFDEKEEAQHEYHKKIANRIAYNLYKAIKSLAMKGLIESEANRYVNLGTDIDVLGRTDLENETMVVEIKILPPRRGKLKKDGTYGFSTQSIKEPKLDHARQVSGYYAMCNKKRPFLVYANEKEYTIFDPSNCDTLTEAAMLDHLKFYKSKAKQRENLLKQSEGDVNKLLSMTDPQWDHPFYWNIGDEFVEQAKQDFNRALQN
jgi:hypothetical protein